MNTLRSRCFAVRAYTFSPASPPREVQLWDVGENPTDYGVHLWTERSAREVMAAYVARGNPLQIDVEHNAADPPPAGAPPPKEPPVTGGYARLELRGGAPWLVFDWSAFAVGQIETRQRLFLSPEYDVDRTTSEIVRLVRVSLVADPGTHHARMLARIAATARIQGETSTMDLATFLAALKAANGGDDPEAARVAVTSLIAEVESALSGARTNDAAGGAPPAPRTEERAGTDYEAGAASDENDTDDPKKKAPTVPAAAATAEDPMKCAAPASAIAFATRIAQLEADAKRRDAREAELEATARVAAAGERIPESLRAFARKLSKSDFETFVAGLPEPSASTKPGGVRAAAKPTRGLSDRRPEGELSEETQRHLARAFGVEHRAEQSIAELADGRVRATHIVRRDSAANGKA